MHPTASKTKAFLLLLFILLAGVFWQISCLAIADGASRLDSLTRRIQWSGTGLQLVGLLTAVYSLYGNHKAFKLNLDLTMGIAPLVRNLIDRFRPARRVDISATVSGTGTVSIGVVTGHATVGTVDGRLDALEAQQEHLRKMLSNTNDELRRVARDLNGAVEREASGRKVALEELHDKLKLTTIGTANVQLMGLGWLCVGIVFTSVPGDIASWLGDCRLCARW